jgi:hypothetical protein
VHFEDIGTSFRELERKLPILLGRVENPKSIVRAADLAEDQTVAEHAKHLVRSRRLRDPRGERRRKFVDDGRGRRPVVRHGSTSLSTIFDTYLLGNPLPICQYGLDRPIRAVGRGVLPEPETAVLGC